MSNNKKISDFAKVKNGDVELMTAIAGVGTDNQDALGQNVKITGTELVGSVTEKMDVSNIQNGILPTANWLPTGGAVNQYINKDGSWTTLPTVPTVNDGTLTIAYGVTQLGTFTANDPDNVTITIPAGSPGFTNLTAGDVVKWDYGVDGPNIELITTQDPDPAITLDNVITMWNNTTNTASDISDIPDGATGTLIVHPTANPYFNFPTGSKISDASNIRLDGSTKVLRWIKEGNGADPTLSPTSNNYGCLYWAGFENFATASIIEGPDVDELAIINSNLYGLWDPNDYTGAVQGTGVSNLGVVNNSSVPSKVLDGSSTGNSLTINNSQTTVGDAWEEIEFIESTTSPFQNAYFKWTSSSFPNYAFNNSTVAPAQDRYTVMIWFKVDSTQPDKDDLGLFDASISGNSTSEDSGYQLDSIGSSASRKMEFRPRSTNPNVYQSLYQNWADDEWCCLMISVDPTVPKIRHLFGNQYTSTNAGNAITGSGIVSGGNTINVNNDGTYIDYLYDGGNTSDPSDGTDPASNLTASEIIEQFTGFRYGEGRRPDFSTFDFQGSFGILALWSGEAKSDADMQIIYDYFKSDYGIT